MPARTDSELRMRRARTTLRGCVQPPAASARNNRIVTREQLRLDHVQQLLASLVYNV